MPTSRSPFRADLEALRGLAILLVVAYHARVPGLAGGFVGVDGRGALAGDGAPLRGLRWFGRLSYGWYLWHWPVLVIALVLCPAMGVWGRLAWSVAALAPACP